MPTRIKKINISAFRGIPDLELNLNGKGLLLKGDNGTGKSSIVDALEFFFCGRVRHLEGVQGVSLQRHGPHIGYSSNDVKVCVTFDPGEVELTRTFNVEPACPEILREYFGVTQTGVFILRRAQILEFIISQPAERFRAIGSIIGLEDLDNIELAMMHTRDNLEVDFNGKSELIKNSFRQLSGILGKEVKSEVEVLGALNDILKAGGLPLIKSLGEAERHAEKMLQKAKGQEAVQRVGRLERLSLELKSVVVDKEGIVKASDKANEKIKGLLGEQRKKEMSVAALLEVGAKVLEGWGENTCPLCQQEINGGELLERIRVRLGTVKALSQNASEVRRECAGIKQKLEEILKTLGGIVPKSKEFGELAENNEVLSEQIDSIRRFMKSIETAGAAEGIIPVATLKEMLTRTQELVGSSIKEYDGLFDAQKIMDAEKEVLRVVALIGQTKSIVENISKTNMELKSTGRRLAIARNIYSKFTSIKKNKVQGIFDIMQADIEKYYGLLHPGDAHKNIRMRSTKRASVELKIESFGRKDEDPRAYGSEGHLDSLGLCIFLVLVKKFNNACLLVVLDDVVTTVDVGHRENICRLLIEEFGDKQLVITTHEGLWYEQLRSHHRAAKVDGNFSYIAATKWDVDAGPTIRPYKPRWGRIEEKLGDGDKSAGNDARSYMEWALESICNALESPIVFRSSREWNVGELFSSAKKRAESLIKGNGFKEKVLKAFKELECTTIYANITSHNNPLAEELSIDEVGNFCRAVHNLYCTFLCPNCGSMLIYSRNFKIIRCSNTKCDKPFEVKAS